MNKKTRSTKNEKWRHTRTSAEIAWTNKQKSDWVVVTSYARNKNRDDEINKNIAGQVLTNNSKNFRWLNRKLDIERTMKGLEKPFRKKFEPKNWKNSKKKIKVKLPHVNKKPLPIKRIFVQSPYSHSTLNLERTSFTPQNHSLFRSQNHFLFRRDQNHYSNLTSKIMKMCKQIF